MINLVRSASPISGRAFPDFHAPMPRLPRLGRSRVARDHDKIRNPRERLKIRRDDVEMRRTMIVRVHPHRDGAEAVQCRHERSFSSSASIALSNCKIKKNYTEITTAVLSP
jgi:hypothetical protein